MADVIHAEIRLGPELLGRLAWNVAGALGDIQGDPPREIGDLAQELFCQELEAELMRRHLLAQQARAEDLDALTAQARAAAREFLAQKEAGHG